MKTVDVIKQASENSPRKAKSSLLRWEPASRSLLLRQGGQWRPAVSIFDGVIVQYINSLDKGVFGRRGDRDTFDSFVKRETLTRLHLFVQSKLPCSIKEHTPSSVTMLRDEMDKIAPKDITGALYWQWAFQHMLVTYCATVRSAAAALESKLNSLITSPAYSQLSSALVTLSDTVCRGRVLNYAEDCGAVRTNLDRVIQSFYSISSMTSAAYSDQDGQKYSRPPIKAKLVTVDGEGNWGVIAFDHNFSICVENPAKLIDHWPDLVSVLASVGISEPTPYGLTFSQDNIAAIASLIDVAKLDYAEPQKWLNATIGAAFEEPTPVSAMELA